MGRKRYPKATRLMRRQQRIARATVESRASEACRRVEASDHSMPFAAGHQQVEQSGAPPLLVHHHQLARQTAAQLPDNRPTDCRNDDRRRPDGAGSPGRSQIPQRGQGERRSTSRRQSHTAYLPGKLELHHLARSTEIASSEMREVYDLFMDTP